MADEIKYWKITVRGPSIQGVMLREAIVGLKDKDEDKDEEGMKLASDLEGIKGFARNYDEHVEVIVRATEKQANVLLEAIRKIPKSDKSLGIISYADGPELHRIYPPEKFFSQKDFEDFTVKRDGEQKEMMLALQGAGKLFKVSAGIQQKVSKQLKERDEKKIIGLLYSMKFEIRLNIEAVSGKVPGAVSLIALQQAIIAPPITTPEFVYQMAEVFHRLGVYQRIGMSIGEGERASINKGLERFEAMINTELETRGQKL